MPRIDASLQLVRLLLHEHNPFDHRRQLTAINDECTSIWFVRLVELFGRRAVRLANCCHSMARTSICISGRSHIHTRRKAHNKQSGVKVLRQAARSRVPAKTATIMQKLQQEIINKFKCDFKKPIDCVRCFHTYRAVNIHWMSVCAALWHSSFPFSEQGN